MDFSFTKNFAWWLALTAVHSADFAGAINNIVINDTKKIRIIIIRYMMKIYFTTPIL